MSSGVERCRAVSRCRVWHLDTDEHGFSLDGVEGCRGVSSLSSWHGLSRCRVGVEVWCRGVEARAQAESILSRRAWRDLLARLGRVRVRDRPRISSLNLLSLPYPNDLLFLRRDVHYSCLMTRHSDRPLRRHPPHRLCEGEPVRPRHRLDQPAEHPPVVAAALRPRPLELVVRADALAVQLFRERRPDASHALERICAAPARGRRAPSSPRRVARPAAGGC